MSKLLYCSIGFAILLHLKNSPDALTSTASATFSDADGAKSSAAAAAQIKFEGLEVWGYQKLILQKCSIFPVNYCIFQKPGLPCYQSQLDSITNLKKLKFFHWNIVFELSKLMIPELMFENQVSEKHNKTLIFILEGLRNIVKKL